MSDAPRPKSTPSLIVGVNGSLCHCSSGTGRHDVGMAREAHERARRCRAAPTDYRRRRALIFSHSNPSGRRKPHQKVDAAGIVGGDGIAPRNELLRKFDDIDGHGSLFRQRSSVHLNRLAVLSARLPVKIAKSRPSAAASERRISIDLRGIAIVPDLLVSHRFNAKFGARFRRCGKSRRR